MRKKRHRVASVLACVVAFTTTYALILPAITVEKDDANDLSGFLPVEEEIIETAAEENEAFFETEDGFSVSASWDEGVLPADTGITVNEIEPEVYQDLVTETLGTDVEASDNETDELEETKTLEVAFVSEGEEVLPEGQVCLSFQADYIDMEGEPEVVAIIDDETAEVAESSIEEGEISVTTESDFVFAVHYTVDFHYEVDGNEYDFSIPGDSTVALRDVLTALEVISDDENTEIDEVQYFMNEIEGVVFTDPALLRVEPPSEDSGDAEWTLVSLQPFETEECLTITMKNGDVFTIRVTDAQEIEDAEKVTIDPNMSYLICYEVNGTYYLLKNDGSVDSTYHPDFEGDSDSIHDFEHLNSTYCWSFNHIFKEQDVEHHLDKNYYLIRPIDDRSKTLSLNNAGEALVQSSNNNIAVIQDGNGFILEGYHNVGTDDEPRYIHLGFADGAFAGVDGAGVTVHIYEMNALPIYDYTVRSADETRGTVTVAGGTQNTDSNGHFYEVESNSDKKNGGTITASVVQHYNTSLPNNNPSRWQNKWEFDHWELDGLPLDRNQYGATIDANTLPIPHNGSKLVAYFRQNPNYVVPESEKEPSSVEDMTGWLEELQGRNIPLDSSATKKTAEVYDYQNRIYRVDFTSKANFETFAGNLDMAFCLDVSNSMYFPSALVETTSAYRENPMPIYQINYSGWGYDNRGWLDTNRGWDNPYYLIADASGTATVYKIYYKEGNWRAIDASRTGEYEKGTKRYFIIGQEDFNTNYGQDARHPFSKGDDDNTRYMIYDAGDDGKNRFVYLNQSLSSSSTDLNTISNLLAVAGNESPGVKIAYNTFNKNLGSDRRNFQPASSGLTVDLSYSSGGGTRPDQAFNDAQNFSWTATYNDETGETNRYVILVTDGAPQGVRDGENNIDIEGAVRTAAQNLKDNSHVKLITVGLSMDSVTSGKRLLYDLADYDNNGEKMFYMAESGSDLENIFRQIIKVLMEDAVVLGDITDTVGDAFYLVDKSTGMPLNAGDKIDIEGNLTTDQNKVAGIVQEDGKSIKWYNQPIDSVAGWHGTVYVKAQEELLGGNGVNTNKGEASIVATKYRIGGKDVSFDKNLVRDTLNLTAELPSPKVNVNELTFFNNETKWTVYLGTEVDPKEQLKAIYDSLVVEEVVNKDGSLHYTIDPNSIEERWNDINHDTTSKVKTYSLPGLIERLIQKDSALSERYFDGNELKWDVFLGDVLSNGITLPYHEYGLTDRGNIKITLGKTIADDEEDDLISHSPHKTTVTGNEVEKYVFRIAYEPDYSVTPIGQGGGSTESFHTGIFGSMYQGHAAGRETSTNTHVINVYSKALQITKMDEFLMNKLQGAEFVLYRTARDTDAVNLVTQIPGLDGRYYPVKELKMTGKTFATIDPIEALGENEEYYLVETKSPNGYNLLPKPLKVELTSENSYTKVPDGTASVTKPIDVPYNWEQKTDIVIDKQETGGSSPWAIRTDKDGKVLTGNATATSNSNSETVYYNIKNDAGYELPSTGGPGQEGILAVGGLLVISAAAGLILRRRKLLKHDR